MRQKKRISKQQMQVIEDLFDGQRNEQEVLKRYKVKANVYRRWLVDETFSAAIVERMTSARRQSAFILARYAPVAAVKLVALTQSDKDETVRKACLDILEALGGDETLNIARADKEGADDGDKPVLNGFSGSAGKGGLLNREGLSANTQISPISPEKASKMLAILAEEEKNKGGAV